MNTAITRQAGFQEVKFTVTMESIRAYADLTQDFNPIHLDEAFAAKTPMGQVIAHGTLSLCVLWKCIEKNFGKVDFSNLSLEIRFTSPVFVNDVITAGGQAQADNEGSYEVWVRGQDGKDRLSGVLKVIGANSTIKEG